MGPIDVVVPVLNEEGRVGRCLEALAGGGFGEVVVADGGSTDATARLARAAGARVVEAPRGRARQMNAGAAGCTAPILVFLHVDTVLPRDAARLILGALSTPGVVAGAFRTRTVDDCGGSWIDPLLPLADLRATYTRLPYGDQALFVRRAAFDAVGGFPDQPLFEDLELARRLWTVGRIAIVPGPVRVSARRYLRSPLRMALAVNAFPLLYQTGLVSSETLARWYSRT